MMNRAPQPTTYFLVPGWKDEDFVDEVGLGNIILDIKAPHKSISAPSTNDPILELDNPLKEKEVTNFERIISDEKKRKIGLFVKILELLGVGVNVSHATSGTDTETYAVDKMILKTFRPTEDFLKVVVRPEVVQTHLKEGGTNSVFLITGTAIAEGITYKANTSNEKEKEGSLGLNAHGFNIGPSGSDSNKQRQERKETHPGPQLLAFRVQKIQLGVDLEPIASPYDGDFYGEEEEEEKPGLKDLVYAAELNAHDKAGMNIIETVLDITDGDEKENEMQCLLMYPKSYYI